MGILEKRLFDTFHGEAGQLLSTRAPDIEDTVVQSGWVDIAGYEQIKLYHRFDNGYGKLHAGISSDPQPLDFGFAVINTNMYDFVFSFQYDSSITSEYNVDGEVSEVIFRYVDENNYLGFKRKWNANQNSDYILFEIVDGVYNELGKHSHTTGYDYYPRLEVMIRCVGNVIEMNLDREYYDELPIGVTVTTSNHRYGTFVGMKLTHGVYITKIDVVPHISNAVALDTFTGTNDTPITSRNMDSGHSWTLNNGVATNLIIRENAAFYKEDNYWQNVSSDIGLQRKKIALNFRSFDIYDSSGRASLRVYPRWQDGNNCIGVAVAFNKGLAWICDDAGKAVIDKSSRNIRGEIDTSGDNRHEVPLITGVSGGAVRLMQPRATDPTIIYLYDETTLAYLGTTTANANELSFVWVPGVISVQSGKRLKLTGYNTTVNTLQYIDATGAQIVEIISVINADLGVTDFIVAGVADDLWGTDIIVFGGIATRDPDYWYRFTFDGVNLTMTDKGRVHDDWGYALFGSASYPHYTSEADTAPDPMGQKTTFIDMENDQVYTFNVGSFYMLKKTNNRYDGATSMADCYTLDWGSNLGTFSYGGTSWVEGNNIYIASLTGIGRLDKRYCGFTGQDNSGRSVGGGSILIADDGETIQAEIGRANLYMASTDFNSASKIAIEHYITHPSARSLMDSLYVAPYTNINETVIRTRRGPEIGRSSVTPLDGELIYANDTKKLYIGDGVTAGGNLIGPFSESATGPGSGFDADTVDGMHAAQFEPADATILKQVNVTDTPVISSIDPISAGWAYNHEVAGDPHQNYPNISASETILGAWTYSAQQTFSGNVVINGVLTRKATHNYGTVVSSTLQVNHNNAESQKVTLGANITSFSITTPTAPMKLIVKFIQDNAGNRTITWPSGIKFPAKANPVLSTASNAVDMFIFEFDGSSWFGLPFLDMG